jgi:hypothetical protein
LFQRAREIERRRVAFHRGIRGEDHFAHAARFDAALKLANPQATRVDPFKRRQRAVKNVVLAAEPLRPFESGNVRRLLDDTQHFVASVWIGAQQAKSKLGKSAALLAELQPLPCFVNRRGELLGESRRLAKHVMGESRRRFLADARKLF